MRHRDIPHQTLIFSEWWGSSWIALGFSLAQIRQFWELTNHERWNHASSENPSVVQNARIFLKKCLKPSTMPLFSLGQALLICGPQRYGTHEASLFSQHTDKCFWTTLIPVKVGAVTSWEMPVVGPSHFGSFPLTFLDDLLYAHPVKSSWFPVSSTRPKCWTCSADVGLQTSPGIAVDMTLSIQFSSKCEQQTLAPPEYTDTFSNYPVWTHTYTKTHEQQPYCLGTLSQMTEWSAERSVRQETGWLADRCTVSQQLGALQTHSFSFLTQRTYSCSNFVAISSLVLELLKKCQVRYRVGHTV